MTVEQHDIPANGMTFRCREAGASGEPVILLHGFPETSHMWIGLMERLAAEGYRCLAPDQRGYSPGARPEGAAHYRAEMIAADVFALADVWGAERFHLVGHDWGAAAGWAALALHPERVLSWTSLSVPHLVAFSSTIEHDPDQQTRSQYVVFFQQPGTAEALFSANDFAALKGIWTASPPDEVAEYVAVLGEPGALTAALNWYRGAGAARAEGAFAYQAPPVTTPTLFIWGNKDQAIGRKAAEANAPYMKAPYTFIELDAGHWLIQEEAAKVTAAILAHLAENRA
jgi:pimeloyl-ACP methyl ester carboxylesterase